MESFRKGLVERRIEIPKLSLTVLSQINVMIRQRGLRVEATGKLFFVLRIFASLPSLNGTGGSSRRRSLSIFFSCDNITNSRCYLSPSISDSAQSNTGSPNGMNISIFYGISLLLNQILSPELRRSKTEKFIRVPRKLKEKLFFGEIK